jgi:hypothetical protein
VVPARPGCSEFPNDNPALHDGAVWICRTPCDPARAVVRASRFVGPSAPGTTPAASSEVVAVPSPASAAHEQACEPPGPASATPEQTREPPKLASAAPEQTCSLRVAPPPGDAGDSDEAARPSQTDAFTELVHALQRAALARGATRGAAALESLFFQAQVDDASLDAAVRVALVARGVAERRDGRWSAAAPFAETLRAWRRVLSGESADLSECGACPLDEWAARVLGAVIGAPESQERELRRELRRQGVAAFGMIAQAA